MPQGVLAERFRRDRFFQLGVFFVSVVVIAAVFAPWLAPHNPITGDLRNAYLVQPGSRYILGTDTQGRDVLSRVLYGARLSLSVGVISQSVSVTLGVLLGLLAGYYGRWVDALVMRLADITLAFPTLLLLIAVAAAVKPSLPVVFVVIGIVGWAGMARLVRSQVLVLRHSEFVLAARALGAGGRRLVVVTASAAAVAAAVAASRVFLGVHYLSDVVGGVLLGSLLALSTYASARRLEERRGSTTRGSGRTASDRAAGSR
jgi:ABC-type dipeptide/oligopeptide/nickel transport system permease subunit